MAFCTQYINLHRFIVSNCIVYFQKIPIPTPVVNGNLQGKGSSITKDFREGIIQYKGEGGRGRGQGEDVLNKKNYPWG